MMRKYPVILLVASAFAVGACASASSDKVASASPGADSVKSGSGKPGSAKSGSGKPWWKLSRYSRKADFKTWVWGTVRPGKGLLSGDDEDGIVLYQEKRSGSSDSSKPAKIRR